MGGEEGAGWEEAGARWLVGWGRGEEGRESGTGDLRSGFDFGGVGAVVGSGEEGGRGGDGGAEVGIEQEGGDGGERGEMHGDWVVVRLLEIWRGMKKEDRIALRDTGGLIATVRKRKKAARRKSREHWLPHPTPPQMSPTHTSARHIA